MGLMPSVDACSLYHNISTVTMDCSNKLTTTLAPIYRNITADTSHLSTSSLHIAHHFALHPIKRFFQIHKSKIQFLAFHSKSLLHLFYDTLHQSFIYHSWNQTACHLFLSAI